MAVNLGGKIAFCVGATSGIGRGVAKRLAEMNASVCIAARNKQAGLELVNELKSINPSGTYESVQCEATSMKSIDKACKDFTNVYGKLNYLVMTQGKGSVDGRTETSEGIDQKLALNYYGRIQCIQSLESTLKKTATKEDVRVLSIFSGGVHSVYDKLDDLPLKNNYTLQNAANAAGMYTDLAFDQLSLNYGDARVSFIHSAPGIVNTNFSANLPFPLNYAAYLFAPFAMTPEECAKIQIDNALLGAHMGLTKEGKSGFHLMTRKGEEAQRTKLHNDATRAAVWNHTIETLNAALTAK